MLRHGNETACSSLMNLPRLSFLRIRLSKFQGVFLGTSGYSQLSPTTGYGPKSFSLLRIVSLTTRFSTESANIGHGLVESRSRHPSCGLLATRSDAPPIQKFALERLPIAESSQLELTMDRLAKCARSAPELLVRTLVSPISSSVI